MGLTHNFLHKSYPLPPLPLCWTIYVNRSHLPYSTLNAFSSQHLCLWKGYYSLQKLSNQSLYKSHYLKHQMDKKTPHFINSTYLQHTKHETRTILKYKTKNIAFHAVTICPDFAGHLQVYQPVVFGLTHSFCVQSLTEEVLKRQKWCTMVICSRNSSNQSLKIWKPAFFCFKDLYCLFCSPYPFSCHSYAQPLLLYITILCILPRWENQKFRCYPRWLL